MARPSSVPVWTEEQPIRSELFSVERLEQHAESLAANQPVSRLSSFGNPLSDRLRDNEITLRRVYRVLSQVVEQKRSITPAAEWLLDNYRLVEQQVLEARKDLPAGYYRQLPKLSDGPLAGYPRVVGIAWAYIAHTDSRFDPATLIRFVAAYQKVQPLTIGELWAIAITIRIVLVENLRRLAEHIVLSRAAYSEANTVADLLIGVNGLSADSSALKPYETAPLNEGFIVQLIQRLREQDPNAMPAVSWLESRLAQQGVNADDLVLKDHQQQGALNRAATHIFGATLLPALDLSAGVPASLRTLVAVPTLLSSEGGIRELIERLEVHYLSNPTGALHFALASDWTDADSETTDRDAALLTAATAGIARLNERYPAADGAPRFLLLHRHRVWSETQQRWIGWERKRGKLHELNRLLRGATDTTFLPGDASRVPAGIKYVVTLDSDTRLPRDSVFRLVGKMAHPLNQARLDPVERRVVEGYGILQPRVTPSLSVGAEGSFFQRIFSGNSGIDPYSSAISDVYQDLFGEGSYSGKGIYDVDAFETALNGRVPDGTMLSHDLFEGVFARSGLVSDVELIEEYPSRYDVASARQHRWVRGDWQLLPWMGGLFHIFFKDAAAIPAIGLWKMFDNLRRSLSAPAALLALLVGWTLPLSSALIWTAFVALVIALPTLLPLISGVLPSRRGVHMRNHLESIRQDSVVAASQMAMIIIFLPHQAWLMVDAIARTIFRLTISRRHLLQWTTAAQSAQRRRTGWLSFYSQMVASLVVAAVAGLFVWLSSRASLPIAGPFIVAWAVSPAIARWVSFPPPDAARLAIGKRDGNYLRLVARRTWRFFETFVTEAEHMLPPDNSQEDPNPVVARRTSPTNIGLYLLSTVAARDFGWIGSQVDQLELKLG
ncbi:MAG: hypothetical protein WCP68_15225, partial [Enhydrobacter sp.]